MYAGSLYFKVNESKIIVKIVPAFYRVSHCSSCCDCLFKQAQAAAGIAYCSTSLDLEHVGGYYLVDEKICAPSLLAQNEQLAADLWDYSEQLTGGASQPFNMKV